MRINSLLIFFTATIGLTAISAPASAICLDCEPRPPPPSCTNGATAACTTSSGCDGRKTCTNGVWGSCVDLGVCRQACPIDSVHVVRANPARVEHGEWSCTDPREARAGERVLVRSISTGGNYLMRLFRNGVEVTRADTGAFDYWKRIAYKVPPGGGGSYQACYQNTDWFFSNAMRFTMDVAGPYCDPNPDECFNGRGPGCALCNGGDENNEMLRNCPVTVGSNMHDTCCSVHPGGDMCDGSFPADYSCTAPPGYSQGGYKCCKAEWDHAVADTASGHEWWLPMDSTVMTYRPTQSVWPDSSGNFSHGSPMFNAIQAPSNQWIGLEDAQHGWCASEWYMSLDPIGMAICY